MPAIHQFPRPAAINRDTVIAGARPSGAPDGPTAGQLLDAARTGIKVHAVAGSGNMAPVVTNGYFGTTRQWTYRTRHSYPQASTNLVFWFSGLQGASGYVSGMGGTLDVKAAFELANPDGTPSGIMIPILFRGARVVTIPDGGLVASDPVGMPLGAGSFGYVRTYLHNAGAGAVGMPTPTWSTTANNEGWGTGDLVDSGTITFIAHGPVFGPCAVTADIAPADRDGVLILGTSIEWSAYDIGNPTAGYGYLNRAFGNSIPYVNAAVPGKAGFETIDGRTGNHHLYRFASLCRDAVMQFAVNDLAKGRTLAQTKTSWSTVAANLRAAGIRKVIGATTVPRTTLDTTALGTTLAGQTLAVTEADRAAFNTWLKAGSGGTDAVWDVAATVTDAATQKWLADATISLDTTITGSSSDASTLYTAAALGSGEGYNGRVVLVGPDPAQISIITSHANTVASLRLPLSGTPASGTRVRILNTYTHDGVHPTARGHALMAAACNLSDLN